MGKSKKEVQLGIHPSTAAHTLRKQLMFHLAQKCSMDSCFQCGEKIKSADELSIEHKTPWLDSDSPKELYFNLDNIAFSHLKCNVSAARRSKSACGNIRSYQNGCRCSLCKEANKNAKRIERNKKKNICPTNPES